MCVPARLCQHRVMKRVRPLTTVVVTVALLIGTGIWWFFFRGPSSSDCAPVRELLAYNRSQIDGLNAKTHVPAEGSYEAATDPRLTGSATGLAPSDSRESAILLRNLDPGPYTAIVRGKNNTTGVGLVEIYDVQQ